MVKRMFLELSAAFKRAAFLFGVRKCTDEKEQKHKEFVDIRRRETNLRRSILLSALFIVMIVISFVVPGIRSQLVQRDFFVMGAFAAVLVAYTATSQVCYGRFKEEEHHTKKSTTLMSILFIAFWVFYYIVVCLSSLTFKNPIENTIIWLAMMFVGLSIPIFTASEALIIYPIAIADIVVFNLIAGLDRTAVVTCVPIVVFFYFIVQFNHMERLEAFYEISKSATESSENKRRLGNIFSRVYDMALEVNLNNGEVEVLKGNEFYGISSSDKFSLESLKGKVDKYIFEDDVQIFMRNFNVSYISNEFHSGRNQIYFEGRVLTSDEDYRWVSVLLTQESSGKDDGFLLCLIQSINERKQNEDKLRLEAEKDPLTQLYNKMTTKSLIEECLENNSSSQHALIIIDIDNFKTINDTRGHAMGDQILLAFAAELNKNFRETDILGRAGGDEFIVLIKNVQSIAMVCDKLQHLTASFKKYGIDHGFPGRLSTSIGVAVFNKDGRTYEELFKKADAALYEAKRNGKDQYKFSISRT